MPQDRILTSHAGSLPRPDTLVSLHRALREGEPVDEGQFSDRLAEAVRDVVDRQRQIGVDIVNDGEYGHAMGQRYDYGAWWNYVFPRLGGLELVDVAMLAMKQARPKPGEIALASFNERRDCGSTRPTPIRAPAARCPTGRRSPRSAAAPSRTPDERSSSATSPTSGPRSTPPA
jgi:methionine synthase II (cobalamin-independent)